ncbi:MAG: YqgE/AlgH family protein [Pseudomonadales bacterium]|nr:YqgE/AlgH family protein [Pseudomonadales bacterium]
MPGLVGDYFATSLTYVCEHTEDGALGVIVNRPTDLSLLELLSQLALPTDPRQVDVTVYEGGPVSRERGFVLHSADATFESTTHISEDVFMSTALDVLEAIASNKGPDQYLVALGYAGWGAGQLESEIADNVWLTAPAEASILFELSHEQRLNAAAKTLGIDFNLIAARPGHA